MERILLNKNKSKTSVNASMAKNVELKNSSRVLPFEGVIDKVNLYSVFENERDKCNSYRLIFNINPLCTNVLFNTLTEVVKNEGDLNRVVLEDPASGKKHNNVVIPEATNRNKSLNYKDGSSITRYQAVRNTEYSNEKCGFTYHCGYDIFNNHLLRSTSFKSVNKLNNSNDSVSYNTLFDKLRDVSGKNINFKFRCGDNVMTSDLHLYTYDEVLEYFDSVENNLIEDNGWFGFTNVMKINTQLNKEDNELVNKVINSAKPCEFIDMYPDRTLFSFVPKVNKFQKRIENNWNYCITYPFSSTKNHVLVNENASGNIVDGFYNGLKITSTVSGTSVTGEDIILFRCACKHGLKKMDKFTIIENKVNSSKKIDKVFSVAGVGDMNDDNKDYIFYIVIDNDIKDLFNLDDFGNIVNENVSYRFRRHVNGYDSEYYIRLFKKLPNFKYSGEKPSDKNIDDKDFINKNVIPFDSSLSKLAFSNNVYNDNAAQIVFTDDVNVEYLKDNLGRPLTEIYLTIIKNNAGYKEWYGTRDNNYTPEYNSPNIEFSHCFGEVTSGFELPYDIDGGMKFKKYSNVRYLTNIQSISDKASEPLERDINIDGSVDNDGNIGIFYGDIVEFNAIDALEYVIEPVYHRFNTQQRETENPIYTTLYYDEIETDDYDIRTNDKCNNAFTGKMMQVTTGDERLKINQRPEGYYYLPHYKIQVRSISNTINQENSIQLNVLSVSNEKLPASYYEIKTKNLHYLNQNDYLMVSQVISNVETDPLYCKVIEIKSLTSFVMTCSLDITNLDNVIIRKVNNKIPSYASNLKDGTGRYVWRDIYGVGKNSNTELPEYPFMNGSFYIEKSINFFLKRQDPFNVAKLQAFKHRPSDVSGNKLNISNYVYVQTPEKVC